MWCTFFLINTFFEREVTPSSADKCSSFSRPAFFSLLRFFFSTVSVPPTVCSFYAASARSDMFRQPAAATRLPPDFVYFCHVDFPAAPSRPVDTMFAAELRDKTARARVPPKWLLDVGVRRSAYTARRRGRCATMRHARRGDAQRNTPFAVVRQPFDGAWLPPPPISPPSADARPRRRAYADAAQPRADFADAALSQRADGVRRQRYTRRVFCAARFCCPDMIRPIRASHASRARAAPPPCRTRRRRLIVATTFSTPADFTTSLLLCTSAADGTRR